MTPLEEFALMMEYAGVKAWHEKGIKGRGINVLNCESSFTTHGAGTLSLMKRIAPEANFFCGSTGINTKGDTLTSAQIELDSGETYDLAQYVKDNQIDIINASKSGNFESKGWEEYCLKMQAETGVCIFNSAGNDFEGDGETLNSHFPPAVAILVGALSWNDGNPKRTYYSSVGAELDFAAFSGLFGGTSAASPFLAGMAALIMSQYGKLPQTQLYAYLKQHSKDLGEPGDDIYYGEGMVVLPSKTRIELQIGNDIMKVDGIDFKLDQPPKIDPMTGRTLVPIRAIAEGFGASVTWIDETDTIILEV